MHAPDNRIPFAERIADLAERGDEVALVVLGSDDSDVSLTWLELHERTTQVALALRDLGVDVDSHVGLKLPNGLDFILVALALWKLGATVVPIRWDLPAWEFERVLAVMDAVLVIDESHRGLIEKSAGRPVEPLPVVWPRYANGMLSSGSTGTPKVILRTAPGLYDPTEGPDRLFESYGDLGDAGVVMTLGPMYHANGFNTLGNLLAGAQLIVLPRFDASRVMLAIARYAVTGFVATSLMLQRMANVPEFGTTDLSSLRWVLHGAAPLQQWLARVWIDRIGPERFFTCYGSTERAGFTIARGDEYLQHPGTVGKGVSGTEIRVLNLDGTDAAADEIGEIFLRSRGGVASRYLGADPLPMTDDGYVSIGDLGWLDDDGFLYIADRRADLVVTGGANVYPAEVEAAISEHPDVADVVVIGLKDPVWGRRVHAIVEPTKGADGLSEADIVRWAGGRLAPYKVPKTVEFIARILRTEATKLNRSAFADERDRANGYVDEYSVSIGDRVATGPIEDPHANR